MAWIGSGRLKSLLDGKMRPSALVVRNTP